MMQLYSELLVNHIMPSDHDNSSLSGLSLVIMTKISIFNNPLNLKQHICWNSNDWHYFLGLYSWQSIGEQIHLGLPCFSFPEDKQSILFETSRPYRLFSEPTLQQKIFTHGCTRKFTINSFFQFISWWRRAEYTIRNVDTTPALFRANTPPTKESYTWLYTRKC